MRSPAAGGGTAQTLFHLAVLAVPRPAAGTVRRLAIATMTPARLQRKDGVAFAADDRHEKRSNQRNKDEDGRDYNHRRQRLGSVLRSHYVDETIQRGTSADRTRTSRQRQRSGRNRSQR